MSIQDVIIHTMGLTNHIKDIYYHLVDLRKDNIDNLSIVLDELDGILLKLEQIMSIQPNIFTLQEMDVIYFVDDIQFIRDFLWEWMRDKISLISQNDYRRLDGQLQTLKKLLP